MSTLYNYNDDETRHSDDMQDIITATPPWLLRWGIILFFGILLLIIVLSATIRYPDFVKTQVKIDSDNPPVPVTVNRPGKLVNLLVTQNETVKVGQPLASFESEAGVETYLLIAPQAGKISFSGIIHENETFSMNEEVFQITPGNEQFFGEIMVPQGNLGKVRPGQQVLLKLSAYPFQEYGMLRGKITYITEAPGKGSVFVAKVDFNVKTSPDLKKPINLTENMTGEAEIITHDETFLQRLTGSFKIF